VEIGFTDTSAPRHFGTYIWCRSVPDTSAPVPKCLNSQDILGRCGRPTAGESDSDVSMRTHVFRTVSSCFATLCQLRSVRRSTSQTVLLSLVVSLVLSRLDYGNTMLAGLPGNQLDRLQSVMNAAARLVCSARKYKHITPLLRDLHFAIQRHCLVGIFRACLFCVIINGYS